jgi:hypothetical protein
MRNPAALQGGSRRQLSIVAPIALACIAFFTAATGTFAQDVRLTGWTTIEPAPSQQYSSDTLPEPTANQYFAAPAFQNCPTDCSQTCSDEGPRHGLYVLVDYSAFRGLPDGGWENNGINAGINFGTRLGEFSDATGIGFQIGGSAGADDWSGTDYRLARNNEAEVQGFVTYGLFRAATEESRFSAAVVQDWMINANYGVFAQNPTLSQLRMQVGYAWTDFTEIGVWGTCRVLDDTRFVSGFGDVSWRPLNQLNFYWHHKWCEFGADSWVWIGVPERDRFAGNGSLGDYIAGALTVAPLTDRLSLYALVTYMHPSANAGPAGSNEDAWDFTIGLAFYPAANARSRTVIGQRWMPQLPVANNGYFLVDTNRTF